jgi:hypothetical protein
VQGVEGNPPLPGNNSAFFMAQSRIQGLEAENARLRRLVGELLVANQLLREASDREAGNHGAAFRE